ncbi:unnamed protein product [Diabrotica balteata]|uniref:Uncharacterized protein n=1 Tax=Diabrotica balteata TaxID=107213 RepID=A0A9P0DUF1_DIABA|nr:unnamed protein product [Diabrotica balteata]
MSAEQSHHETTKIEVGGSTMTLERTSEVHFTTVTTTQVVQNQIGGNINGAVVLTSEQHVQHTSEVIHVERMVHLGPSHLVTILPGESHTFDLSGVHFRNALLKVTNHEEGQAVFSAEGGNVLKDYEQTVQKIENELQVVQKVENFHLAGHSSVLVMTQPPKQGAEERKDHFQVTNNGTVKIDAEVTHVERMVHLGPRHLVTLLPGQSHTFDLSGIHFNMAVLKVANNEDGEAVFSAEGGNVLQNMERNVQKESEQVKQKVENVHLAGRSSMLVMSQPPKQGEEGRQDHFLVSNTGNVKIDAEVIHIERMVHLGPSHLVTVLPGQSHILDLTGVHFRNALLKVTNHEEGEAVFSAEGGNVLKDFEQSVQKLENELQVVQKVENFHLAGHSSVLVMTQPPKQGAEERKDHFQVTNNGTVKIDAEVTHVERMVHLGPRHLVTLLPGQSHTFDLSGIHFNMAVLKVANNEDGEAVFSAEGGNVLQNMERNVQKESEQVKQKVENVHLAGRSSMLVMSQPPKQGEEGRQDHFLVSNTGNVKIDAEVIHIERMVHLGPSHLVTVLPGQSRILDLTGVHFRNALLKVTNHEEGEAVFSAEGGNVLKDFEQSVQKLENEVAQVVGKVENVHLAGHSSMLVMTSSSKRGAKERHFRVTNNGNVKIDAEVTHAERMVHLGPRHLVTLLPGQSHTFDLSDVHFKLAILKMVNHEDGEAVFSAEGGKVVRDMEKSVQKVVPNDQARHKVENVRLAGRSSMLVMSQPPQQGEEERQDEFLVSNKGNVKIDAEVIHVERMVHLGPSHLVTILPGESHTFDLISVHFRNALLKVVNHEEEEAEFSAEGGIVLNDFEQSVQKLEHEVQESQKVENFHLAGHSSVLAMTQPPKQGTGERKDHFQVTNNGNVKIDAEVTHVERILHLGPRHLVTLLPGQSHTFDLSGVHFNMAVLKIANHEDGEAVFSAEGGNVLHDMEKNVQKEEIVEHVEHKVENVHLPGNSSMLVMSQPPKQGQEERKDQFFVVNKGNVKIDAELIHVERKVHFGPSHLVTILPGESHTFDLSDLHYRKTLLKVINYEEGEAVFSAEGGNVLEDYEQTVQKLLREVQVTQKVENFHLAGHSSMLVMTSSSKRGAKERHFQVTNNGNVKIDAEVTHAERMVHLGPRHLVTILPGQSHTFDLRDVHFKIAILKIVNREDGEAVFSAEGGKVVRDMEKSVQKVVPSEQAKHKVENVRLAGRSSMLVMSQPPKQGEEERQDHFLVSNKGNVKIDAEVIHVERMVHLGPSHLVTILPGESHTFDLSGVHFRNALLKVVNHEEGEAEFSAEGGIVLNDFEQSVQKLEPEVQDVQKVENFHLAGHSSMLVMTSSKQGAEERHFQVTNNGNVKIDAEVTHAERMMHLGPRHLVTLLPGQSHTFDLSGIHFKMAILKVVNHEDGEAVFSAQGGTVVHKMEQSIQKESVPNEHVEHKVEDFHLAGHSSVLVMSQPPKQGEEERKDQFLVSNKGNVKIDAEVTHVERMIHLGPSHKQTLLPGETHTFDLSGAHFRLAVLKITNHEDGEAVFSAEGGNVLNGFENNVQKVEHETQVVHKVENFHLAADSSVLVMTQPPKQGNEERKDYFLVSNNGKVKIEAEVTHVERILHLGPRHVVTLLPGESHTFDLSGVHFRMAVLKVTNYEDEEAIFSAEGGNALQNLEKNVQKVEHIEHKVQNVRLPSHSSVLVLAQPPKENEDHRKDYFRISNNGNVKIDAEIVQNDLEQAHTKSLLPGESHTFDLNDNQFHLAHLKVSNLEDGEAVFSAEGGNVLHDFLNNIQKVVAEKPKHKLDHFLLPPRRTVLALSQNGVEGEENNKYTITNHGPADLFVEVVHINHIYDAPHWYVVRPDETTEIPINEHLQRNLLRLTNNSYKDEVVVSAEGGHVLQGIEHNIEQLSKADNSGNVLTKVENFSLPPRSYIVALSQNVEGSNEHPGKYIVTNHGKAAFDIELKRTSPVQTLDLHRRTVQPNATEYFELTAQFQNTVLEVINTSQTETAVFTAEGGDVMHDLQDEIKKLDVQEQSTLDKIINSLENLRLNARSRVLALVYDPKDATSAEEKGFTITNHGKVDVEAEVVYTDSDDRGKDEIKVIKPNETVVIEHVKDAGKAVLNILNRSYKELGLITVKGGRVIHELERKIKKLASDNEVVLELDRFHLAPNSSVVVMHQIGKYKRRFENFGVGLKSRLGGIQKSIQEVRQKLEGEGEHHPAQGEHHQPQGEHHEREGGHQQNEHHKFVGVHDKLIKRRQVLHDRYTITNYGYHPITVQIVHLRKGDADEVLRSQVVKPNETQELLLEGIESSSLKVINESSKDIAIFSAEGGEVIHGVEHLIRQIHRGDGIQSVLWRSRRE